MKHLNPDQVAWLRAAIEQEIKDIVSRLQSETDARENVDEPLDLHELATLEADRRRVLQVGTQGNRRLEELMAARQRLDRGDFGICEESDEPIPFGRLRENPAARFTAEMQAELEESSARARSQVHHDDGEVY